MKNKKSPWYFGRRKKKEKERVILNSGNNLEADYLNSKEI